MVIGWIFQEGIVGLCWVWQNVGNVFPQEPSFVMEGDAAFSRTWSDHYGHDCRLG